MSNANWSRRNYSADDLEQAVKNSISIREVLIKLGLKPAGGNYATLKRDIVQLNLDVSHFKGQGHGKTAHIARKAVQIPLTEILVNGSHYQSYKLKRRLLREGVKLHQCESCGLSEWQKVTIPLELHHVNGDALDNRLENLQLLCPNCHALTANYRAKNIGNLSA